MLLVGVHRTAFFMRKGADCLSKWVGEAERQLRLLFEEARACQPSIIFFDEIDGAFLPFPLALLLPDLTDSYLLQVSPRSVPPSKSKSTPRSSRPSSPSWTAWTAGVKSSLSAQPIAPTRSTLLSDVPVGSTGSFTSPCRIGRRGGRFWRFRRRSGSRRWRGSLWTSWRS